MEQWTRLCSLAEVPKPGEVTEAQAGETSVCLANVAGRLSALDNWCPHRRGPLGQGWIEGDSVLCPWHAWAFSTMTGRAVYPPEEKVAVFALRIEGEDVEIDLG